MARRDLTGTPESGRPLTPVPTAEILIDEPEPGSGVAVPMRPKGMSARDYRERYDSLPHVIVSWTVTGEPDLRGRVAGAVSAAVMAHGLAADDLVTIYPEAVAPTREALHGLRAYDGKIVEVASIESLGDYATGKRPVLRTSDLERIEAGIDRTEGAR